MAIREEIGSMTIADLRNELEANGLSTSGNKSELVQRIYQLRRGKRAPKTLAASFSNSPSCPSTSSPKSLDERVDGLIERVNEREKNIDEKLAQHFEQLNKQLMLFVGAKAQNTQSGVSEFNFSREDNSQLEENTSLQMFKLKRKLRMLEMNIDMIFNELELLQTNQNAGTEVQSTLKRLEELESNYGDIIQEIILLIPEDSEADLEIQRWTKLKQDILRISFRAENYIESRQAPESKGNIKAATTSFHNSCSGVNHLRLPKFTLPIFNGDILDWVAWWDRFKSCIHENNSLGDMERFNYLLMYVSGAAKRAIEFIEVTSQNYPRAIEVLRKRYGRKRIVIEHLVESLLNIERKDRTNASSLRDLHDTMLNRYHTLNAHEPNLKYCHRIIVPILQSKLPPLVRKKWEYDLSKLENEEDDQIVTVDYFFNFLRAHVMSEEAAELSYGTSNAKPRMPAEERKRVTRNCSSSYTTASSSAIALTTRSSKADKESPKVFCAFCEKSHETAKCYMVQRKSADERFQLIKDKKLCFNCLFTTGPNHNSFSCKNATQKVNATIPVTAHVGVRTSSTQPTYLEKVRLLPTALAKLHSNGKETTVRILVVSGSDHSYIRREVAQALELESNGPPTLMTIHMHGGQQRTTKVTNVSFELSSLIDVDSCITLSAWSVNTVCAPLDPVQIDVSRYAHLSNLRLADECPSNASTIDVLIGADQWGQVVLDGVRKGPALTPFAVNSIFGWLLSGCIEGTSLSVSKSITNVAVVRIEDVYKEINTNIKRFWEIESQGIADVHQTKEVSGEEKHALDQFESTISFDGEGYEVGLPWRRDKSDLKSNYQQALRRLVQVEKRLGKSEHHKEMYRTSMNQYLSDGHARKVTKEDEGHPEFYLPHQPVFREDKTTTKCRILFDGSAKNLDGISLNDIVLPGPALQPNLLSILLRFRLNKIAMMADIKKMFLQIKLNLKDQNCHRFLWRESPSEVPEIYCMTRVTFGVVSSPFQAIATVKHHCKINADKYAAAAKEVQENMYVDDILTGAKDANQAFILHKNLYSLMKSGGFELVKWYTNSKELHDLIEPSLRGTATSVQVTDGSESLKVLGISWDTKKDAFNFTQGTTLLKTQDDGTKRSLISLSARIFDPLGFLGPYTIRTKIMFQDLCVKGVAWDEPLNEEVQDQWNKWKEELRHLQALHIARCPLVNLDGMIEGEIHGFCDASLKAYGAAVYLRCTDSTGTVQSHLLVAKNKVAPVKRVTLPRLELLGALILSRLIKLTLMSISIVPTQVRCWSDSQVVIEWISQPSNKWKVFVANRVQEIKENISASQWSHCPGALNPADFLTRGESLEKLVSNKTWWNGPEWLSLDPSKWPNKSHGVNMSNVLKKPEILELSAEAKKTAVAMTSHKTVLLEERYESWNKLVRVTAWLLKWKRLHKQPKMGYLTADEFKDAEHTLVKKLQRSTFQDEITELEKGCQVPKSSHIVKLDPKISKNTDLLVVGGRLQFASIPEEAKHQIILPHKCTLTEKIILHVHSKANHAGPETTLGIMRQRFWPTQGRREIKRVLRKCLVCKHWKTSPVQQKMAPLPSDRVQIVPPFTNIGLDFTGPLLLKTTKNAAPTKAYICIFVCEDTRAVHLELTGSMTTEEFLKAFQRMTSRRGIPTIVRSDNQTTFHKAAKVFKVSEQVSKTKLAKIDAHEVENRLANDNIKWKFITERASHRGGHWERVCRQIKEPLRRVLGKALLTYTEMYTVLTSIEATINSRPLTFIGEDIRDGKIVTPAVLAIGRDLGQMPDVPTCKVSLDERFYYQQQLQNHFWKRWTREYLPKLTMRQKWTQENEPLKKNDVVLVSDDNLSRGKWKLGKIVETFPGADGLVRTARVRTAKGTINRPVQRLHLLESFQDQHPSSKQVPQSSKQQDQHPSSTQVPKSSKQQDQHPSSKQVPQASEQQPSSDQGSHSCNWSQRKTL